MSRPEHAETRDRPLNLNWRIADPELRRDLELSTAVEEGITAVAMQTWWEHSQRWISYSRRHDWWSSGAAALWWGLGCTCTSVCRAVDRLAAIGLLEHDKQRPGSARGWQSRFRAGPALIAAMGDLPPRLGYASRELILLRDSDRKPLKYRPTRRTETMRRQLDMINRGLMSAHIDLDDATPCLARHEGWIRLKEDHAIFQTLRPMHRVFNQTFNHGGRLYGPWFQSVPGSARGHLLIDDEPCGELDYGQTHPRMLAAEAGIDLGQDAYEIAGWDRNLIKRGMNIAINAQTYRSAVGAIAEAISGPGAFAQAKGVIAAIKKRHPQLEPMLHSGAGLRLQCLDAQIAILVVTKMLQHGVVTLPIHDSFICQRTSVDLLRAEMQGAWHAIIGTDPVITSKF